MFLTSNHICLNNVNLPKDLCHYYLEVEGKVTNYFYLVRVTMIALIMRIILA